MIRSFDICFLELSEEFPKDWKHEFESAKVNEPSVFDWLKFYSTCILIDYIQIIKKIFWTYFWNK